MEDNLVIVESPAKAKTIEKFLGKDFKVVSSFGHIRDLAKKNLGIDLKNKFKPDYEVPADKKKLVADLKKMVKGAKTIWLASDEDREGEAISWHLSEVLNLKPENTNRIVFNEITKEAILASIQSPRAVDLNLVNAQQARRVLDRLVGFELSPVLWKKVKPALSAGRVQSVAVRLIVEREREIIAFQSTSSFKVYGIFEVKSSKDAVSQIRAELSKSFKTIKEVKDFINSTCNSIYSVDDVTVKPARKSPPPPFTTSTLQQEASRKLGLSVAQTMSVAQKLYESGLITYMRTDSVNLSNLAIGTAKKEICDNYGEKYHKTRQYATKSKGAQEAHEAIRPTYMNNKEISGSRIEKKLYDLIWKRTIASQMSEAEFEKTNISIAIEKSDLKYSATGEVLKFDGFLKVYNESTDDETNEENKDLLPAVNVGDNLQNNEIQAIEKYSTHLPRYTEASLVRKMEELGIGRPSTYAPTISTIQNRDYVVREDRPGKERISKVIIYANGVFEEKDVKENYGFEKAKLFPTDIGMVVNDFLLENFDKILDFNFTATVEKQFDEIAQGELSWETMIEKFYDVFHKKVEETLETSARSKGERELGIDPESGKPVTVKIGRYGPIAQLGTTESEEKPKFASLRKNQHLETITLEEALELFRLPRSLGELESKEMIVAIGRFGPYIRHDSKFYSLGKQFDPFTINSDEAIEVIKEKREAEKKKVILTFPEKEGLMVLNGRYGPYISFEKSNYKIPAKTDPAKLSLEECLQIIEKEDTKKKNKK